MTPAFAEAAGRPSSLVGSAVSDAFDSFSDADLMRAAQAGADAAFAALVERHQAPLLRFAHSRLGRRDWAEDAVQETLLAAFKSRMTFDVEGRFRSWLWTILLNQCRRQVQWRMRTPRVESWSNTPAEPREVQAQEAALPSREPTPLAALLAAQRDAQLQLLLAELSEVQADALRLRFFGGLKFSEIAEAMGCSLPTAKNRVRWGLLQMAKRMGAESAPEPGAAEETGGAR